VPISWTNPSVVTTGQRGEQTDWTGKPAPAESRRRANRLAGKPAPAESKISLKII